MSSWKRNYVVYISHSFYLVLIEGNMIIYSGNILSHIFEPITKRVSRSWVNNFIPRPTVAKTLGPNFSQAILECLQMCYGGLREAFITFFQRIACQMSDPFLLVVWLICEFPSQRIEVRPNGSR